MFKVLICIEDKVTTDVVKTAIKQFSNLTPYPVPRSKLVTVLTQGHCDAAFVDLEHRSEAQGALIRDIRAVDREVEIMALVARAFKERFNRTKVELGIFSFVTTPLDCFELARRIVRLREHLIAKNPAGAMN